MECNKDEAVRAKKIAEFKLRERDIIGAKKFALKALNLYPELEGLTQFLDIVNVYVAQENTINGEVDYYRILGVDPSADEELIRRQYKRLALSLHPDKNKSVGADGAFMILSQAWCVLSDKDKRTAYDMKLDLKVPNQSSSFCSASTVHATDPQLVSTRPTTPGSAPSPPCFYSSQHPKNMASPFQYTPSRQWTPLAAAVANSRYTPAQPPLYPIPGVSTINVPPYQMNSNSSTGNHPNSSRNPPVIPGHQKSPASDFMTQFDPASRPASQNRNAHFKNQPMSSTCPLRSDTFWTLCNKCRIQYEFRKIYLNQNLLCPRCQQPFLATPMPAPYANSRSSYQSSIPHQQEDSSVASMPETVNKGKDNDHVMKKSCSVPKNLGTASAPCTDSVGINKEKPVKRRRKDSQKCNSAKEGSQGAAGYSSVKRASSNVKGYSGAAQQPKNAKELSQLELRTMLARKARVEILSRLNQWESEKSGSQVLKRVDRKDSLGASNQINSGNPPRGLHRNSDSSFQQQNSTLKETDLDAPDESVCMTVPDANFHNFDNGRIEESFTEGQIWAAYDDDDGMPRYYALIHHVMSRSPFKMQISWLNSKSSSEFGTLDWIASGFSKTSGEFRSGKFMLSRTLNSFSHPVKSKKGTRGVIQIFPTKGDVWALYRNWSSDWDENTADEIVHKYDLVVILEDHTEDKGVLVAPLVKVPGFTSVFKQLLDQRDTRTISREEMFRFSHQVPFFVLSGLEAENAPNGCYELDPAALPLELLKVITSIESTERGDSGQLPVHERSSFEESKTLLKYSRRKKKKGKED